MIKQLFIAIPFAVALLLSVSASGCRDKCKNVSCENGECIDGNCACETGYTGELCSQPANESFEASYDLEESCTAGTDRYTVDVVAKEGTLDQLEITGLWGKQIVALGVVQADGRSFTIERQAYGNVELSGSGEYSSVQNDLSVMFSVYQPSTNNPFDVCRAELDRE